MTTSPPKRSSTQPKLSTKTKSTKTKSTKTKSTKTKSTKTPKAKITKTKTGPTKKNFSSFNLKEAYKQLKLRELQPWLQPITPTPASLFFQEHLARIQRHFDLDACDESKKLLIDAVCAEALEGFDRLKVWKGAALEGETTTGIADYLIAERRGYLEAPFLCIIEAKKDDFEQGLAQCLVEMQACQWENQQVNRTPDTFGIVSNGNAWSFYQLLPTGQVYKTDLYALTDLPTVLGWLKHIFHACEQYLTLP